jgi:hypothetical protein
LAPSHSCFDKLFFAAASPSHLILSLSKDEAGGVFQQPAS